MIISQKDLKTALQKALPYTTNKTIESLSCVRISGNTISATNLDMSIDLELPATELDGAIMLPARRLHDAVAAMPAGDLKLTRDGLAVTIAAGTARMTLRGMDADNYPELPQEQGDSIELPAEAIQYAAEYIVSAAAGDNMSVFGSVLLDKGAIVATDTHRLHCLAIDANFPSQVMVPRPAFLALAKLLDGDIAKLTFGQGHLHYAGDNVTYSARLMAGQYPQWRQVINNSPSTRVTVDRQELEEAVRLAVCVTRDEAKERRGIVRLEADERGLTVSARSAETGYAHTDLAARVEGDDVQVLINGGYLLDMIKPISGAVTLEFAGATKPVVARHGDYTALCLPIRDR